MKQGHITEQCKSCEHTKMCKYKDALEVLAMESPLDFKHATCEDYLPEEGVAIFPLHGLCQEDCDCGYDCDNCTCEKDIEVLDYNTLANGMVTDEIISKIADKVYRAFVNNPLNQPASRIEDREVSINPDKPISSAISDLVACLIEHGYDPTQVVMNEKTFHRLCKEIDKSPSITSVEVLEHKLLILLSGAIADDQLHVNYVNYRGDMDE